MTVNHKKLNKIVFDVNGHNFAKQLTTINLNNDTDDAEILHTFGGAEEDFAEPADPSWSLDLEGYSDWTVDGFSDYLTAHDGETANFTLTHHVGVVGWENDRVGQVLLKAPSVGGDIRDTEVTKITLAVVGVPTYERS